MTTRILSALAAAAALAALAACGDSPSAPAAALAPGSRPAGNATISRVVSQQVTVGDTVITEFVVGTNSAAGATFGIGHQSRIDFPSASASICDPATSSYGPGTWDSPCQPAAASVTIVARVWKNAQGKVATDFQPALRFVPGQKKPVLLTMKDAATAATRVDYCTPLGGCVDEAAADASLCTVLDANNGFAYRPIKHFSGYTVVVDRSGGADSGY